MFKNGARKDGIYSVTDDNRGSIQVRCDMTTAGGGWTIFQRRLDGSVDFYRGWQDYKIGFGQMGGEFWLGLDELRRLSNISDHNVLRIDMDDFEGGHAYAQYDIFQVGAEDENYKLHVQNYSGGLPIFVKICFSDMMLKIFIWYLSIRVIYSPILFCLFRSPSIVDKTVNKMG